LQSRPTGIYHIYKMSSSTSNTNIIYVTQKDGLQESCRDAADAAWHAGASSTESEDSTQPAHVFAYQDPPADAPFQPSTFHGLLRTRSLGHTLLYAPVVSSTQQLLVTRFSSLPPAWPMVADIQCAGKGRGSNVWTSPPGVLAFSVKCTLTSSQHLVFLQYLVSLLMVQAVDELAPNDVLRMKWPNDLYANGMKVGGVLCNSTYNSAEGTFECVCGVGLNVANTEPTTCLHALLGPASLTREALLAAFMNRLEPALARFDAEGFGSFQSAYLAKWLHSDEWLTLDGGTRVCVKGLTDTGYLLAQDAAGVHYELHPDFNSLDFFRGLIGKKMM